MSKDKINFGFVYIWFDCKHKRFYVGSHWGSTLDKYVCSSTWMNNSYKRRPADFRRRILETVTSNRDDLYEREYQWLSLIKDEQLGKRYYNLKKTRHVGVFDSTTKSERISKALKGRKPTQETIVKRAASIKKTMATSEKKLELSEQSKARWAREGEKQKHSEIMKAEWADESRRGERVENITAALNRPETKKKNSDASLKNWQDPAYRQLQIEKHTDLPPQRKRTEEENLNNSLAQKEVWAREGYDQKMVEAHLNSSASTEASKRNIRKTHTPEAIAKAKETNRLKREAAAELRRNNPELEAEYKRIMKERAQYGAMKRWHPELIK